MESGQLFFNDSAEWLADLEHELLHFPTSTHDDQVDVLGYAGTMYTDLNRFSVTQLVGRDDPQSHRDRRLKEQTSGRAGKQKVSWRNGFQEFKKQLW